MPSKPDGHRYAFGLAVDRRGEVLASGEVRLDLRDSAVRLRSLVQQLAGDGPGQRVSRLGSTFEPLPWSEGGLVTASEPADASSATPAWASWTSTGLGVVALGSGLALMTVNDECARDRWSSTKVKAIAATTGGVALSVVSGYLWAR